MTESVGSDVLADDAVLNALVGNSMLSVLGRDVLRGLAANAATETFSPGDLLLAEGESGDYGYLILAGDVSIDVGTSDGPVAIARIGSGRLVGEIGVFADMERTASVRACTPVSALKLSRRAIQESMRGNLDVALAVIGRLGLRLQQTNKPMAILTRAAEALRNDKFSPEFLDSLTASSDEFSHFAEVFKNMATEIRAGRDRRLEMDTASSIQQAFLPRGTYVEGKTEVEARMIASKHVGGDFFDYFRIDDNRMGFLIADVAGKGVPAALFMAKTLSALRAIATSGIDAATCVTRTNALISERNDQDMFVTLFYADLDLRTGELTYCNAGHEPSIHLLHGGGRHAYPATGPALGLFDTVAYQAETVMLNVGDMLVLYTDGVTEAFDPDDNLFGEERLFNLIDNAASREPAMMVDLVMDAVDAFAAGRDRADDTTCLALVYGA